MIGISAYSSFLGLYSITENRLWRPVNKELYIHCGDVAYNSTPLACPVKGIRLGKGGLRNPGVSFASIYQSENTYIHQYVAFVYLQ